MSALWADIRKPPPPQSAPPRRRRRHDAELGRCRRAAGTSAVLLVSRY